MLSPETTKILFDTLVAGSNDVVDAYIAGLRKLTVCKEEFAALKELRIVDLQAQFIPIYAERYPIVDDVRREHATYEMVWRAWMLIGTVLRGDYDPGGVAALPVEVAA